MDLDQLEPTDKIIEQFGRQILVPGINEEGQIILANRKVCIIGLGALGTIASQYLVRSGIGEISLLIQILLRNLTFTDKLIMTLTI